MKASRLVLFLASLASIALVSKGDLSADRAERHELHWNQARTSTVDKNSRVALTSVAAAQLPLFFEANRGQTDAHVKFLSRGSGYTLFLTPAETVLVEAQTKVFSRSARTSERLAVEHGEQKERIRQCGDASDDCAGRRR